jgi:gas vesicle protein
MNNRENYNQHQGSGFFNGFLLGIVVGAAIVFLVATKKGKKILKLISEEGLDSLENLIKEDELDELMNEENSIEKNGVPEEPILETNGENKETVAKKRRFFKRAK